MQIKDQCALAIVDRDANGKQILRCTSTHVKATPVITGEVFKSVLVNGEADVLLRICPGTCGAFVAIDQLHGHIFDVEEER